MGERKKDHSGPRESKKHQETAQLCPSPNPLEHANQPWDGMTTGRDPTRY